MVNIQSIQRILISLNQTGFELEGMLKAVVIDTCTVKLLTLSLYMLDLNEIMNIPVRIKVLWNPLAIKSFANLCFMVNITNSNRMNLLK